MSLKLRSRSVCPNKGQASLLAKSCQMWRWRYQELCQPRGRVVCFLPNAGTCARPWQRGSCQACVVIFSKEDGFPTGTCHSACKWSKLHSDIFQAADIFKLRRDAPLILLVVVFDVLVFSGYRICNQASDDGLSTAGISLHFGWPVLNPTNYEVPDRKLLGFFLRDKPWANA